MTDSPTFIVRRSAGPRAARGEAQAAQQRRRAAANPRIAIPSTAPPSGLGGRSAAGARGRGGGAGEDEGRAGGKVGAERRQEGVDAAERVQRPLHRARVARLVGLEELEE